MIAEPPIIENGVVVRFVGVCLDITEEEQRIDQLRLSEAFMAQAQRKELQRLEASPI